MSDSRKEGLSNLLSLSLWSTTSGQSLKMQELETSIKKYFDDHYAADFKDTELNVIRKNGREILMAYLAHQEKSIKEIVSNIEHVLNKCSMEMDSAKKATNAIVASIIAATAPVVDKTELKM